MVEQDVEARLITFIRDIVLHGDPGGELDAATPLLEWGVLNSLSIALLLNFIRDDLRVMVPLANVNAQNFRDVRSIAALIQADVRGRAGGQGRLCESAPSSCPQYEECLVFDQVFV